MADSKIDWDKEYSELERLQGIKQVCSILEEIIAELEAETEREEHESRTKDHSALPRINFQTEGRWIRARYSA